MCKTNPQEFELDPIGFIRILASQLIDGMTDNCTETDSISLYFDNDPSIGFIEIYCGDLGDFRQFERTVWIYAEDDWGNVDSCQVTLKVTDPDENCIIKDSVLVLVQTILQNHCIITRLRHILMVSLPTLSQVIVQTACNLHSLFPGRNTMDLKY